VHVCRVGIRSIPGGAGPDAIPPQWIEQVNEATRQDPYTNSKRTIEQTADGIYDAFVAKMKRLAEYQKLMAGA
jgi:hypothetical protein